MQKPSLSNKVFTENPLLDEIVYNARQLATGTILKDSVRADINETLESIQNGDIYVVVKQGIVSFGYFNYTEDILYRYYPATDPNVPRYAADNSLIPEADRPALLTIAKNLFLENYVEYNNYYRMLNGEPDCDLDTLEPKYGLFVDVNQITIDSPTPMSAFAIDDSKNSILDDEGNPIYNFQPVHELDLAKQNILYETGTCENIFNDSQQLLAWDMTIEDVEYLLHIGDRKVDYYTARVGEKFALLYCPPCDAEEVRRRYKELIEANRLYILYTVYSEAYKYRSDYYDNFMMIFIILQTIIDMIIELPEYIIRRDIFDSRTCKYIFESNGVKYFKDIPLKYQIALVKNLNKLIKFKSTDKCLVDIVSIFGTDNIQLFRYYIMKDRLINEKDLKSLDKKLNYYDYYKYFCPECGGEVEENTTTCPNCGRTITPIALEDNGENYDLKFIKVPILGNYDDNIRTDTNLYNYSSIVDGDAYWTGDKDYDDVKQAIKDLDFTILRSKYYSVEALVDITKRNFVLVYFMNLLMYNKIDKSSLKVNLPNISTTKKFELVDAILTLYSLSYLYYGVEDTIIDSRAKAAQILGFNMEADLAKIDDWLYENHRGLDRYHLHIANFNGAEDGVDLSNGILSFKQLEDLYFTNKDIYDHVKYILRYPPSKEIYDAYKYIFNSLMVMNRNMEYFLKGAGVSIVENYKSQGYKVKFINIPGYEQAEDPDPIMHHHIKDSGSYHNPDDYIRDLELFYESLDYETLYFVMADDFDESHMFDLYIKSGSESLSNVGQVQMASTYREFFTTKDASIYSFLNKIYSITDFDTRQEACINAIQAIVSYLQDYIDQDKIDVYDLFGGVPSISLDFIKNYVTEVIDYFKSFKIFTHSSSIRYLIDDKYGECVNLIDWILLKYLLDKADIVKIEDYIEGKIENKNGILVNVGHGIQNEMTSAEKYQLIDKMWFDIDTWIQKNYKEYYESERYSEFTKVIRDYVERYSTLDLSSDVFTDRYIPELETEVVDAILKLLVSIKYGKEVIFGDIIDYNIIDLEDTIDLNETRDIEDHYEEWIADLYYIMIQSYMSDTMPYQDDMTRFTVINDNVFMNIFEKLVGSNLTTSHKDKYKIFDNYYKIITQEFPEHVFDA